MFCPNCHKPMKKEKEIFHCLRCGYTSNGSYIEKGLTERKKTELERYLDTYFIKVLYNENFYIPMLIGPLYFSYFQLHIVSFLLTNLEIWGFFLIIMWTNSLSLSMLLFILTRVLYAIYANQILLFLVEKKIKKKKIDKISPSCLSPVFTLSFIAIIILLIFYLYSIQISPHGII